MQSLAAARISASTSPRRRARATLRRARAAARSADGATMRTPNRRQVVHKILVLSSAKFVDSDNLSSQEDHAQRCSGARSVSSGTSRRQAMAKKAKKKGKKKGGKKKKKSRLRRSAGVVAM
jgi:hypothetical protein